VVGVQLITQLLKEVERADVHISRALLRARVPPKPAIIRQVSPHAMLEAITVAQLTAPQARDLFQFFNALLKPELERQGIGVGPYVDDPTAIKADKRFGLFPGYSSIFKQYADLPSRRGCLN
jgi:hypothetical protein